jgi:hypothetical protein
MATETVPKARRSDSPVAFGVGAQSTSISVCSSALPMLPRSWCSIDW